MVNNFPFHAFIQLNKCSVKVTNFGVVNEDPQWKIGSHQHDHFELHYIDNGLGINISPSSRITLSRGTLYIAKPGEAHAQASDPKQPMKLFYAGFHVTGARSIDPWELEYALHILHNESKAVFTNCFHLEPIIARIVRESTERNDYCGLMIESLFSQLMVELYRTIKERNEGRTCAGPPSNAALIRETMAFMKQNVHMPYSTDVFAAMNCMSPGHFRRLFRQVAGLSPAKYFLALKIDYAKALLTASHTVSETAEKAGFESVQHFSKTFKKMTGVSPGRYGKA